MFNDKRGVRFMLRTSKLTAKFLVVSSSVIFMTGCATAEFLTGSTVAPIAEPIERQSSVPSVVILSPKSSSSSSGQLQDIRLLNYKGRPKTNFGTYYEVTSHESQGQLVTGACDVRVLQNMMAGRKLKGCDTLTSNLVTSNTPGGIRVEIRPSKHVLTEGRTSSLIQQFVDPPKDVTDSSWTKYLRSQSMSKQFKYQTQYPAESLRANFDRKLSRFSGSTADGDTKQYQARYMLPIASAEKCIISTNIAPYRNGSLAEISVYIENNPDQSGPIDWISIVRDVDNKLKSIVNQ